MKRIAILALTALVASGRAETEVVDGVEWTFTVSGGVATVGRSASYPTALTGAVAIPSELGNCLVAIIDDHAFDGCSRLTSIAIPASVTRIGNEAFYGCYALDEVRISDLTAWCGIAFGQFYAQPLSYARHLVLNGEELSDLVVPDGVTKIGYDAF